MEEIKMLLREIGVRAAEGLEEAEKHPDDRSVGNIRIDISDICELAQRAMDAWEDMD